MAVGPTISIRYARRIIETAAASGIDRATLEAAVPLTPIQRDGDVRITGDAYLRLWGAAMERADPEFPLRVAAATGIETYEVFGFACMTSRNFREALERASRYLKVWTDLARWELRVENGQARLLLIPAIEGRPEGRFAAECALAEMCHTTREYLGVHWRPGEVRFRWRQPRRLEHLTRFFEAPLAFECPHVELVFDEALLSLPLAKSDPAMAAFFARHAEEMIERLPRGSGFSGEVRLRIANTLGTAAPTLATIAAGLGVSARTLRRRLGEEDQTFVGLVQETRSALAKQHVKEGRLTLGEIAFLLGFSDVSAFHRSFRRWTGMTPASYRRGA